LIDLVGDGGGGISGTGPAGRLLPAADVRPLRAGVARLDIDMRGPALVGVGWPMPTAPESLGARGVALVDLLRPLVDLASVLVERESEPIVLVVLESSVERALSCFAVIPANEKESSRSVDALGLHQGKGAKAKTHRHICSPASRQ
jgi:hypothetical protein